MDIIKYHSNIQLALNIQLYENIFDITFEEEIYE